MMKALTKSLLAALVLLLVIVVPVRAADERAQTYVIVVGIDRPADARIKPRPHAEADAQALYDLFTSKDYLGVPADHVRLLLGGNDAQRQSEEASRANILKALQWVVGKARRNDLVLFVYIGGGAPLGERACYFAADSTYKDRAKNAVAAADIESELDKLKSQRFCALIDVNFKAFDPGTDPVPDLNLANFYKEFLGKEDAETNVGRVVFLAGRGLAPSLELAEHGVFTQVLLDGLKGSADKEGYEPDGWITVDELTEYLNRELPALVRKNGKTKEEREQVPFVRTGQPSHFRLTRNPEATAKVQERLAKLKQLAADRKISAEAAEEGQTLLSRMPRLEAYRSLRKDFQALADGALGVDDFLTRRDKIREGMKLARGEAIDFANKVIDASEQVCQHYVKELNQGELVGWAIRGIYQRIDEPLPQEIRDRLEDVKTMRVADLSTLLADVRELLGKREDLDKHKDIDHALQRMLSHLDPYTTYIDPGTMAQFERDMRRNYTGIGIQIRKDAETDMLVVVTPIKGSPAYKKGILAGDVVTQIICDTDSEGKHLAKPEVISTKGLALNEAVKRVMGKADTKVKLTIERAGANAPFDVELTRSVIELETVLGVSRKEDDTWEHVIDPENRIGYIRLSSFSANTFRDLSRVVSNLEKQGVRGLILDLRFNPGGLLRSAVSISDLFVDEGAIVSVRPRVGREEAHVGKHAGSYLDFPMVCLVNGTSASASEIVSACLQDQGRAVIAGERSYGKGSVQNIQPFDGGQLKLTTSSFWRPSGKNLNKSSTAGKDEDTWGVTPDKGFTLNLNRKERDELAENLHEREVIPRRDVPAKKPKSEYKDRQLEQALDHLRGRIKTAAQDPAK